MYGVRGAVGVMYQKFENGRFHKKKVLQLIEPKEVSFDLREATQPGMQPWGVPRSMQLYAPPPRPSRSELDGRSERLLAGP